MDPRFITGLLLLTIFSTIYGANNSPLASPKYPFYRKANRSTCVFPFKYNGNTYNDCTTDGDISPTLPWCSLTKEYKGYIAYCHDFRNADLKCSDSYNINGKQYQGCDYIPKTAKYKQCQTNSTDLKLRYCIEEHIPDKGKSSVLGSGKCDPVYSNISPTHTMCVSSSDSAIPIPFTDAEKTQMLTLHNTLRNEPLSKCMFKLYWDEDLANMAQKRADQCTFAHDQVENRIIPKFNWLNGQNLVRAFEIVTSPITLFNQMFTAEKARFRYGDVCAGSDDSCLHYSQIMLGTMTRVGCAHTHCMYPHGFEHIVVCNYIHIQYDDTMKTPYELRAAGATSSDCAPDKQVGNLCDCGNITCDFNTEKLDPATCSCIGLKKKRSIEKDRTKHGAAPVVPKPFGSSHGQENEQHTAVKRDVNSNTKHGLAKPRKIPSKGQ